MSAFYTLTELSDMAADPNSSAEVRRLAIKCAYYMGAKESGAVVARVAINAIDAVDFGTGSAYQKAATP